MTNDNMRQQTKSRQQKLIEFHRRNRLKKNVSSTAATTTPAADATSKDNVKVVVVEAKLQGKQTSTPIKTAGRQRPAVAPISNTEIESRWALTPSQKKLSALVSSTLPYHNNKKCEKNSTSREATTSIRLKVLQQQHGTKGVTPSLNEAAAPKPAKSRDRLTLDNKPISSTTKNGIFQPTKDDKDELKNKGTSIQPNQVAPPGQMASSQATRYASDSTKVEEKKDSSIPVKNIVPQPAQENTSQPEQEEVDAPDVVEEEVGDSRSDSAASEKEAAPKVQATDVEQPESVRTPPPPPLRPVVAQQHAVLQQPPTLDTTQKELLEVTALKAATCPDGSPSHEENKSPSSTSWSLQLKQAAPPNRKENALTNETTPPLSQWGMTTDDDMSQTSPQFTEESGKPSLVEDKVSIPKEQPSGGGVEASSDEPVVDDAATEDTVTTQSTEEDIVESSDSDNSPAITFDTTSTTKESSSIFSLLTPNQTATDAAVVDIPAAAQEEDSPKDAVPSSEQHATAWDTTPDVAQDENISGSCNESPKPQKTDDRLHRAATAKAPAVVALAETGEDETMGWETILSRNSSSVKDKQTTINSDDKAVPEPLLAYNVRLLHQEQQQQRKQMREEWSELVEEKMMGWETILSRNSSSVKDKQTTMNWDDNAAPEPLLANHVRLLHQEQQQQRKQKREEWSELVEEKKMEDDDEEGLGGGQHHAVSNKDAWRKVVKESGSFGILSSITGSYEQQSLGQSEDDKKDDDEDSAMLRPSSSNVSYELRIVSRMIDSAHLQLSSKVKPNDAAAEDDRSRNDNTSDDHSCSDSNCASTTTFEGATSTFLDEDVEEEFERTLSSGQNSTMPHCMSDSTGFVTDDYSCETSVTPGAMESMDGDDECSELTPRTSSLLEEDEDQCDTTVDTDLHHQLTRSFSFSAAASGSPDDTERRIDLWSCFCPFLCTGGD